MTTNIKIIRHLKWKKEENKMRWLGFDINNINVFEISYNEDQEPNHYQVCQLGESGKVKSYLGNFRSLSKAKLAVKNS